MDVGYDRLLAGKGRMLEITYQGMFVFITLAWIGVRVICGIKNRKVDCPKVPRL